jgi:hypothetical protein
MKGTIGFFCQDPNILGVNYVINPKVRELIWIDLKVFKKKII